MNVDDCGHIYVTLFFSCEFFYEVVRVLVIKKPSSFKFPSTLENFVLYLFICGRKKNKRICKFIG